MLLSYAIWALLTISQSRVPDTQVTVKVGGPLVLKVHDFESIT